AAAVMAMLLTGSTTSFAGMQVPSESAFQLCFIVGAVAAFVGAAITAAIPVARRRAAEDTDTSPHRRPEVVAEDVRSR
ncbi:MAG: hypothetical protein Q7J48_20875, partial [Nocardioides sp.]|nr:hypothetical protein [Nocardioides sp.]